ncbi:MAG: protein kinase family protein [Prevotella sp.]|nr:protein kinase family protein [Prevotella sp.]
MNNKDSIIHLMIIWSKALSYKDYILDDLQKDFTILKVFRCSWEKEKFLDNFFVFYSHSQCHRERNDYRRILENKVNVCGDGEFTAIILKDDHPLFEERETSGGVRKVNTRVFDKKYAYREMVGGGHRIHSSDDAWETNKDLTILFGKNTEDFCRKFNLADLSIERTGLPEEDEWKHNCLGVGGYHSISELFYVLNNTIEYVVLRNHEVLPEEYTVEGHGDIDLLVANKNYAAYLTLARPVFKESYRVYHIINIAGKDVPFDFRYVQDNYYCPKWEQDILKTRVMSKDLFYIPSPEHQFYSLLYHAYIQKWEIKPDYFPKLASYGETINVTFSKEVEDAVRLLDQFMLPRNYEFVRPDDKSVLYNKKNLQYSEIAFRHGECIKQLDFFEEPFGHFYSAVFKKDNSFVKIGTDWLLENECSILKALDGSHVVPSIIRFEELGNNLSLIEESRVPGIPVDQFFCVQHHLTLRYIQSFVSSIIGVLKYLVEHQIVHRDIMAGNILVSETNGGCSVSLIDFGWSCSISDLNKPCSRYLGGINVDKRHKIDSYECSLLLKRLFPRSEYVGRVSTALKSITFEDYMSSSAVVNKLENALALSNKTIPIKDRLFLLYRRGQLYRSASNRFVRRLLKGVRRRL